MDEIMRELKYTQSLFKSFKDAHGRESRAVAPSSRSARESSLERDDSYETRRDDRGRSPTPPPQKSDDREHTSQ